ncbi:MAG: lipopolysaccharide heptosyltransferase II, partial [Elusimicrobiaceae bacterium]|nr:lipopolysaccharide heptosyltransferase II [Elusimicrobiaceae bacterium]
VLEKHSLEKYLSALEKFNIEPKFKELEFEDWKYTQKKTSGKKISKIAILQTAFLGDTVLTAPLIKETAKIFPQAKISVITRPETKEIFKPLQEVSEIIIYDKHKLSKIKGLLEIAKKIEKKKFNIIIVPHRSFTSALIAYLSKTKVRVGFSSSAGKFLYTKTAPFSWMMHDFERNLSLLKTLADENQNIIEKDPSIYPTKKAQTISSKFKILEEQEGKKLVAIHPGSVWLTKRWFPERFAKVIEELETNLNAKTVLIGGKSDSALAKKISDLSNVKPIDLTGKTSLSDLMNIMPKFDLFITNDSGPMHIACAYKVPTIAIFGPTTKELGFFPYSKNSSVLEVKDLKCRPCALHGGKKCPRGHFLCMKLITKDMVISECKKMLSS